MAIHTVLKKLLCIISLNEKQTNALKVFVDKKDVLINQFKTGTRLRLVWHCLTYTALYCYTTENQLTFLYGLPHFGSHDITFKPRWVVINVYYVDIKAQSFVNTFASFSVQDIKFNLWKKG